MCREIYNGPISVLPVLSKATERVVYRQVCEYLCKNHLLSDNLLGFRRSSSTEQAVTYFTDRIRMCMDKVLLTGAIFIDSRRAFYRLDHAQLLSKQPVQEIIEWFESYLVNQKHFAIFDDVKSEVASVTCGVPLDSILGPLLFSLLINHIDLHLKTSNIILNAYDTVIFTSNKSSEEICLEAE